MKIFSILSSSPQQIPIVIDNVVYNIQKIGGISVVWYEITKRLIEDKRFNPLFIEFDGSEANHYRRLLNLADVNTQKCSRLWFLISRYINPRPKIKTPYIFHSTYYRVSRDRAAINVTTVHDFTYERSGGRGVRTRLHMWQQKQAVMKSDIVVCISENTKHDLLHYYKCVDPSKVHVVYNGVSDDYRQLDRKQLDLPFPANSYCIYVGVRRAYKNYDLAVKACKKANCNLVLVGSPLREEEVEFLDSTIGAGKYCCESGVSNERLNELYNGTVALLYLSSYEGFGIPCLEAQNAGCPVIAYNCSSIPEVVCDKAMLVDKLDEDIIVQKIEKLKDDSFRAAIVAKGIEFAKKFSWDNSYKQLTDLYIDVLGKKISNTN